MKSWIRVCVFSSNLVVLVNGSPTQKIKIKRCLKHEGSISSFLFLMVVEGPSGLIKRDFKLSVFSGFKFPPSNFEVFHL